MTERKLRQDLDFFDQKYWVMFDKVTDLQRTVIQVQRCQYMRGEGTAEDPYDLMEEAADELASKEVIRPVQVEPVVVPAPVPKGQGQTCLK